MRARSVLLRVAVATSTIVAVTLGSGVTAHAAPPELKVSDVTVLEGNSGTTFASFTINYGGSGASGVSVDYATADETATAGSDYTSTSGTVALPNGGGEGANHHRALTGGKTPQPHEKCAGDPSHPG